MERNLVFLVKQRNEKQTKKKISLNYWILNTRVKQQLTKTNDSSKVVISCDGTSICETVSLLSSHSSYNPTVPFKQIFFYDSKLFQPTWYSYVFSKHTTYFGFQAQELEAQAKAVIKEARNRLELASDERERKQEWLSHKRREDFEQKYIMSMLCMIMNMYVL